MVKLTATGSEVVVRSLFESVCVKCNWTAAQSTKSCRTLGQANELFDNLTGTEEHSKVTFTYTVVTKNIRVQSSTAHVDFFCGQVSVDRKNIRAEGS